MNSRIHGQEFKNSVRITKDFIPPWKAILLPGVRFTVLQEPEHERKGFQIHAWNIVCPHRWTVDIITQIPMTKTQAEKLWLASLNRNYIISPPIKSSKSQKTQKWVFPEILKFFPESPFCTFTVQKRNKSCIVCHSNWILFRQNGQPYFLYISFRCRISLLCTSWKTKEEKKVFRQISVFLSSLSKGGDSHLTNCMSG